MDFTLINKCNINLIARKQLIYNYIQNCSLDLPFSLKKVETIGDDLALYR